MTKKAIVIGCGALAAVAIAAVIGIAVVLGYMSKDVEGVAVSVNGPRDVVVGQTFDLEVLVANERPRKALRLSDVDISDQYLAGFTIASVKPKPKSTMHVPIDNSQSFTFGVSIPAGGSNSFTFTLRAEKPGIYRGDVDVCEGARFVTALAQTVVKEKE